MNLKDSNNNNTIEIEATNNDGKNKHTDSKTSIETPQQRKENRRDKRFAALRKILYCTGGYMAVYGAALLVADWRGVLLESQSLAIITTTGGITFGTLIGIIAGSALDS